MVITCAILCSLFVGHILERYSPMSIGLTYKDKYFTGYMDEVNILHVISFYHKLSINFMDMLLLWIYIFILFCNGTWLI